MEAKKELARRTVQDFHGEQAAKQAGENWAKLFQKGETPEDIETVELPLERVAGGGDEGAIAPFNNADYETLSMSFNIM